MGLGVPALQSIPYYDVLYLDIRMVIASAPRCFFPILDGCLGTPVKTGKALLAPVLPYGPVFIHSYIGNRAYFFADAAPVAV